MNVFSIDMLRAKVMVLFEKDPVKADAKACEFTGHAPGANPNWDGFCYRRGRRVALWFAPSASRSIVFHECYHATVGLIEEIGGNGKDEELNAHLHEFITERVLTLWEKQKGK